jgi:hypothetical protein
MVVDCGRRNKEPLIVVVLAVAVDAAELGRVVLGEDVRLSARGR